MRYWYKLYHPNLEYPGEASDKKHTKKNSRIHREISTYAHGENGGQGSQRDKIWSATSCNAEYAGDEESKVERNSKQKKLSLDY